MEKIYEVVRIKQVVSEIRESKFQSNIASTQIASNIATKLIGDDDREVLLVLMLDNKNKINAVHRCHVGTLCSSLVHPREVFKAAILNNSARIILAHQHPSGYTAPSQADFEITRRLKVCGELLGIELLDHLVVNSVGDYYSFLEESGIF